MNERKKNRIMHYQDWLALGGSTEVYNDVKRGVKAGESYVVKDNRGMFTGTICMDSREELKVSFERA